MFDGLYLVELGLLSMDVASCILAQVSGHF